MGTGEGIAKVYTALAALATIAVLCIPWLDILVRRGMHRHLHAWIEAVAANVICLVLCLVYVQLYRGMSHRIAVGGNDAMYLDRVRLQLATFASGASTLALIVWTTSLS